jgi:AraC-like DNA-binding protein
MISSSEPWVVALVAALAGASVIAGVALTRERAHRRRVGQLIRRLGELESLLAAPTPIPDTGEPERGPVDRGAQFPYRGRLSTLISSLIRRSTTPSSEPERIDLRAVRHLYDHLDEPATPSTLASTLNVSLRTLQRRVANTLGCSPRDLIVAVKMREAKRLLASGDHQVGEAARAVGFDDAFYFSKRFRAYYGVAPSTIRAVD